jgi:pimeloyl-ACP methyl ester carboxylesterase/DNA-binding CsgD family transcriptional regulator
VSDAPNQQIRLLTAPDGVRIAFARTGTGPTLVRAAHWLSHLEFDWESPVWKDFLRDLSAGLTLVRYDARGTGLSDRDVADLSFEAMVGDLESVVDELGLERFVLLGMSQGAAISIAYAVRHPERVSRMVLCGGYARGHAHRGRTPEQQKDAELMLELIRLGWGTSNPKYRRVFATMFMPDGTPAQTAAFDDLQRVSATPDVAYRLRSMFGEIDVTAICGQVRTPTLVMHVREDAVVPFDEGRLLAALIPNSRFVPLPGRSHVMAPGVPAWERFFAELRAFVAAGDSDASFDRRDGPAAVPRARHDAAVASLTAREQEVMRLVAAGRTNAEIADALVISPRTVERHLANVYVKLDLEGKAARAAAAARYSRTLPG